MVRWLTTGVLIVSGLGAAQVTNPVMQIEGKKVPPFTAKTITGETIKTDQYKGKVVVLVFWAPH